jgi:hypothetical protein
MCPKKSIGYELLDHKVQNIDNKEDWDIAKASLVF